MRAASRTPKRRLRDRADLSAEADLAEYGRARSHCTILHARRDGGHDTEIGSGFVDAHSSGNIDIHIVAEQMQAGAFLQ